MSNEMPPLALEMVHVEFEKTAEENNKGQLLVTVRDPHTNVETSKVYDVTFITPGMARIIQSDVKMKNVFERYMRAEVLSDLSRLVHEKHSYKHEISGQKIEFALEEAKENEEEENVEEANDAELLEEELAGINNRAEDAEEENGEEANAKIVNHKEDREVIDSARIDAAFAAQKKLNKK